ncbi:MAG: DUF362 domain-containing protein [Fimbriimonadales bacterium]|nr:MAG: hypothetical protein KatS3mg018_2088 [Fimbriimonadales bacterium]
MSHLSEPHHSERTDAATVAVYRTTRSLRYPAVAPYHPDTAYPEYPFKEHLAQEVNSAYESVRGALQLLGFDKERFGTPEWNPLAEIIRPDDLVVIKPNMVRDFHEFPEMGTDALITHGSIVRAVVDYVYLAKGGRGTVIIADSPQNDADWDELWRLFGFDELLAFYRQVAPEFDLRIYEVRKEAVRKKQGVIIERYTRPGDPFGYSCIDLGVHSEFEEVRDRLGRLYGAEYDISDTNRHHQPGKHEYFIANTFLRADVVINVPKLKTHKKSGTTVWIKSVIGINGDKNWLPHHTEGLPSEGGDQFAEDTVKRKLEQRVTASAKRFATRIGPIGERVVSALRKLAIHYFGDTNRDTIRSGNWHGNDTIWRTVYDVLKCWIYADKQGQLQQTPQRKFLCIVDGIIGGEGNGPLAPTAKPCGVCIAGFDPLAVDTVSAALMGFDPTRLKILNRAEHARGYPISLVERSQIRAVSNHPAWNGSPEAMTDTLDFEPHFGWVGYLEAPHRRPDAQARRSDS